ncbi:MAG: MFS transporter [Conexivisphaerales archaeon]
MAESQANLGLLTVGVLIGSIIEQYDFLVTGTVAALIWPHVFFGPGTALATAIFTSVAIYGLGLIIRPVGAYAWGHIGDRLGRRNAMVWALVVMGIGTLAMGLTPGFAVLGAAGLILLSVFRLVQGFSFGGEFGSASTWLIEGAANTKRRGFWGSWVGQSLPMGIIAGSGSVAVITHVLPFAAVVSYGWRILFVIGFLAAVAGVLIRLRLRDSPLFEQLEKEKKIINYPASRVWKEKTSLILHLSMLNAGIGAAFWLNQVFGVSYMSLTGIPSTNASLANVYAAIVAMFFMYAGGILADRIGRRYVILTGMVLMVVLAYPYVLAVGSGIYSLAVAAQILFFSLTVGIAYPAQPAFFAEHFPTKYRASGVNSAYQISQVYGGGLAPILATYIVSALHGAKFAWPYLVVLIALYGVIAIAGVLTLRETKDIQLAEMQT